MLKITQDDLVGITPAMLKDLPFLQDVLHPECILKEFPVGDRTVGETRRVRDEATHAIVRHDGVHGAVPLKEYAGYITAGNAGYDGHILVGWVVPTLELAGEFKVSNGLVRREWKPLVWVEENPRLTEALRVSHASARLEAQGIPHLMPEVQDVQTLAGADARAHTFGELDVRLAAWKESETKRVQSLHY